MAWRFCVFTSHIILVISDLFMFLKQFWLLMFASFILSPIFADRTVLLDEDLSMFSADLLYLMSAVINYVQMSIIT